MQSFLGKNCLRLNSSAQEWKQNRKKENSATKKAEEKERKQIKRTTLAKRRRARWNGEKDDGNDKAKQRDAAEQRKL